jgi:uncharacterized membrane protein YoaK (UPF0700 family)
MRHARDVGSVSKLAAMSQPAVFPAQVLIAGRVGAAALGFVAGFADAFGYMRWHAFGANMTGNTVMFALDLYRDPKSALLPLGLIVLFLGGSVVGRLIVDRFSPSLALITEAILIVAAALTRGQGGLNIIGVAMGVQNASIAQFAGVSANTGFLTGDYSRLGQALADLVLRNEQEQRRRTISILIPLVLAYATGALAAAAAHAVPFEVLLVLPIVLALVFASSRGAFRGV